MTKARSPGYPTIGLREAIEKVQLVYTKDYQNKISRKLVAQHMGYQSLNGKSLGVLSAVFKYGLLEGRGDENKVSDLALEIIAHPVGAPERAKAVTEAAGRPELFAELDARFQGGKASDAALRSFLLTQKFIPAAADMAVRSYRETKDLVNEEGGVYSSDAAPSTDPEQAPMNTQTVEQVAGRRAPLHVPPTGAMLPGEREILRGPLSRDSGWRLFVSGEIGAKELGKIIKFLTLQQEVLGESEEMPDERDEGR
jgi:hypothetical protein